MYKVDYVQLQSDYMQSQSDYMQLQSDNMQLQSDGNSRNISSTRPITFTNVATIVVRYLELCFLL